MAAIALTDVSVERGETAILSGIDLRVGPGERLALLGPSGAGKTALLRVMAGLDRPQAGSVEIGGSSGPRSGDVTMVFQDDAIYEHLSVEGNLAFPLEVGDDRTDVDRRIEEAARRFLLASVLDRSPGTLSAGQRRVVSAARALTRPDVSVVLLDDPLTGADQKLRRRLVEAVLSDPDLTVVFATREGSEALRWGDRVAVLVGGRLVQVGAPVDVFRRSATLPVAEAMGEMNRIPASFAVDGSLEVAGSRIRLAAPPAGLGPGSRVVMGVRPAALSPAEARTPFRHRLRGTVGRIEQVGAQQRILFGLGEQPGVGFCALVDARLRLSVGDRVDWALHPGDVRLYDPLSGDAL